MQTYCYDAQTVKVEWDVEVQGTGESRCQLVHVAENPNPSCHQMTRNS